MATQASLDQIQNLYIAYYGRPADSDGLNYWATALEANNGNLGSIVDAFANSAESTALYGANSSPEALVTAIYQNVLHRAPEAGGLEFYANALAHGQISAGNLALAVLNGVQNDDVATVQNELAAANQFTAHTSDYGGDTAAAIGRTFLAQVSGDDAANSALLSHLTSYVNAASAATTNPSEFDGQISGGVLTNPAIVDSYASGTTPSTGGDTGGSTGGDTGGSTGGDTGGSTGGDTGGSTGGDTGGSTGGDTGGSTGGDTGGSTGGDTSFKMSVDSSSHLVSFSNPASTVTVTSITPGTTNTGDRTITATSGGVTTSVTVQGDANHHVVMEGFAVSSGQSLTISDQLINDWSVSGAGNVHVTSSNVAGTYDLTSIAVTGTLTIDPDTSATFVLTVAQAGHANLDATQQYALADTISNLANESGSLVNDAIYVNIVDTAANILDSTTGLPGMSDSDLAKVHDITVSDAASIAQIEAIEHAAGVGHTVTYSLTDGSIDLGALAVSDVATATAAAQAVVDGATNVADLTLNATYTLNDTVADLTAAGAAEIVSGHNIAVSDTSLAAADLNTLDGLTTGAVDATAAATLTGALADVNTALAHNAFSGSEAITLSDTSSVDGSALATVLGQTTGLVDASQVTGSSVTLDLSGISTDVSFKGGVDGNSITAGTGNESLDVTASVSAANTIDVSHVYMDGNSDGAGAISSTLSVTGFKLGGMDTLSFGDSLLTLSNDSGPATIAGVTGSVAVTAINGIVSFNQDVSSASFHDVLGAVENVVNQTSHSVAAFEYGGDTYVVAANANMNDTVVKLAGVSTEATTLDVNAGAIHIGITP